MNSLYVHVSLFFLGWKGQDEGSLSDFGAETTEVIVTVKGRNVGYGSTCECLVQSALVILKESDKIPGSGGMYNFAFLMLLSRKIYNIYF